MLTETDIDILLDALKEWEARHAHHAFMGGVMTAMLTRGADPQLMEEERRKDREEMEKAQRDDAEIAILLKAKLVQLRRDAQSAAGGSILSRG